VLVTVQTLNDNDVGQERSQRRNIGSTCEVRQRDLQEETNLMTKAQMGRKKNHELIPEVLWWHGLGRICVAQGRDQCRAVMNMAIKPYFVRDYGE
jgi:hypothetical protein